MNIFPYCRMLFSNWDPCRGCWTTLASHWGTRSCTCLQITSRTDRRTDSSRGRLSTASCRLTSKALWCATWTGILRSSSVLYRAHSWNSMCMSSKSHSRQVMLMLLLLNFIKTWWIIIIANVHLLHIDGGIRLSYGVIRSNASKGQVYTTREDLVARNETLVCF